MKIALFFYNILNLLMDKIDKEFENRIVILLVDYWIVFLTFGITFYLIKLIIYYVYKFVSYIHSRFKNSKYLLFVRWEAELKVFFERMYFNLKINKVNHISFEDNEFRKSRKYSPTGIYEAIKSVIKIMIHFDIYNIFIWAIVTLYQFDISINDLDHIINKRALENILLYFKGISLNNFIEIMKNISFIVVSILIITGYWSYLSTYRKISNEKLGKALLVQEKLVSILGEILYNLEENINNLLRIREYLPDFLSQLITHTDAYIFKDNKLINYNDYRIKYEYKDNKFIEQKLSEFKSFEENIVEVENLINEIKKDNLWHIFRKLFKSMHYEEMRLNVISKEHFKNKKGALLSREYFVDWMIKLSDKTLIVGFEKIVEAINRSAYEKGEQTNNKISFSDTQRFYEEQLEKKLIKFNKSIDERLREAIEIYIILEKYLYKLEKINRRLEFFSKLK